MALDTDHDDREDLEVHASRKKILMTMDMFGLLAVMVSTMLMIMVSTMPTKRRMLALLGSTCKIHRGDTKLPDSPQALGPKQLQTPDPEQQTWSSEQCRGHHSLTAEVSSQ